MITGDQALPQPDDIQDPVTGAWRPTLPTVVLRREALLRSFRWIFAVVGANVLWDLAQTIYIVVTFASRDFLFERGTILFAALICYGLARSVAGFWALSNPVKLSRPVLDILLAVELGTLAYIGFNVFLAPEIHALQLLFTSLSALPEFLVVLVPALLAHLGSARILYSPEGIGYFAQTHAERDPEIPWIAVIFGIFTLGNWFVCNELMKIIYGG